MAMGPLAEKLAEKASKKMKRTVKKRAATRKRNRTALKKQKGEELKKKKQEQGYGKKAEVKAKKPRNVRISSKKAPSTKVTSAPPKTTGGVKTIKVATPKKTPAKTTSKGKSLVARSRAAAKKRTIKDITSKVERVPNKALPKAKSKVAPRVKKGLSKRAVAAGAVGTMGLTAAGVELAKKQKEQAKKTSEKSFGKSTPASKKSAPAKVSSPKKVASSTPSFGSAFKSARSSGKSSFTWKGKKYNTKTKEEAAKKTKSTIKQVKKPVSKAEVVKSAPHATQHKNKTMSPGMAEAYKRGAKKKKSSGIGLIQWVRGKR